MSASRIWKLFWVLLFAGIVLFVSQLRGCKRGWVIEFPVVISENGDKMVFVAGPASRSYKLWPDLEEARPFVLDLMGDTNRAIEIKQGKGVLAPHMAWRSARSPAELYMALPSLAEPNIPYGLLGIQMSNSLTTLFSGRLTEWTLDSVGGLGWSPDGNILATWSFLSGLRFSFDGGKTFVSSGPHKAGLGRFEWKDSTTIYICEDDTIQELAVNDGHATIIRTVASAEGIRLFGVLGGKAIYLLENRMDIYADDRVFYESSEKIGPLYVADPYVAFQLNPRKKDSPVSVLDKDGNVVSEREAPAETIIIGLSSKRRTVYLLKDLRAIQAYNFVDNGPITTLYRLW